LRRTYSPAPGNSIAPENCRYHAASKVYTLGVRSMIVASGLPMIKKRGQFTFCAPSTTTNKNYLTADCRWLPATICFPCERAIIANFLFQLKEKNKQLAHNGYKIDQFWLCEASCRLVGTEDKTQSDQKVHGAKGKATKAAA